MILSKNKILPKPDQSAALLIAEHERISALYQHSSEMGDKYVTTYLTAMSLIIALLVGIGKFGNSADENISIELAIMVFFTLVGISIFRRIVERRSRMIEYLRAINRINHYFTSADPAIKTYLYWDTYDDRPPADVRGTFLGGLRDIMGLLISSSIGVCSYLFIHLTVQNISFFASLGISAITVVMTLLILKYYAKDRMKKAEIEMKKKSIYPKLAKE